MRLLLNRPLKHPLLLPLEMFNTDQYNAVRALSGAWIADEVSLITVTGEDRYTWLQGMVSNDTRRLKSGDTSALFACVLDATGHLLADIVLHDLPELETMVIEAPSNRASYLLDLLDRYIVTEDVALAPASESIVTVQGPDAAGIASEIDSACQGRIKQRDRTGSGGFDIWLSQVCLRAALEMAKDRWATIIDVDTRELLRIEAGIPKYGVDMDQSTIALEAGLGPSHISLTKGCYMGQEVIARIDSRGHTNRALTGLVLTEGEVGADAMKLYIQDEGGAAKETGRITSFAPCSPAMSGQTIALGYVRNEHREPGTAVSTLDGSAVFSIVELPFYRC